MCVYIEDTGTQMVKDCCVDLTVNQPVGKKRNILDSVSFSNPGNGRIDGFYLMAKPNCCAINQL